MHRWPPFYPCLDDDPSQWRHCPMRVQVMVGFLAFYSSHGNLRLGPTSFPPSRFSQVDNTSWPGGSTFNRVAFEGGRLGEKLSTARAVQRRARRGKTSSFNLEEETPTPCQVRVLRYFLQSGEQVLQERNVTIVLNSNSLIEYNFPWSSESWIPRRQRIV